ncbi:MAG TPA: hypothetical protein VJY35_05665 [Candidatus Eisenbacteria bacterium]|nr:hypothetical protein [Candidatus Eisenbacteria bacterium]
MAVALSIVALVLLLPIRLPSAVDTYAAISPEHRWVLAKAVDGQLIASTFNYRSGLSEGFRVSTFNAGSSINFSLRPSLLPGHQVAAGDTVGSVVSSEVAERLITLQGQLAAARNLLAVNASGQKSAVVKEAQQRLLYAQRRRAEYQPTMDRTQLLFDQHLIPAGEYDRIRNEANALDDQITLAATNVEASETGAKPEQINLINSNIATLETEIAAVKGRAATYTVTAPIAGTVMPTFSPDTLVTITGPEYLALVPVRWADYKRVAATPSPRVTITGIDPPLRGTLVALSPEVRLLRGMPVVIATAQLDPTSTGLMPGMLLPCQIRCSALTPRQIADQLIAQVRASHPGLGSRR